MSMRRIIFTLLILALIPTSLALTGYQQGVLDGLSRGWFMAQRYCQAQTSGDPVAYNQAVPDYDAWITEIFGQNESLMVRPISRIPQIKPYFIHETWRLPVHEMDASWNRTFPAQFPEPDAFGLVYGWPAETYYGIGPALDWLRA
jgi:hypothetical protein